MSPRPTAEPTRLEGTTLFGISNCDTVKRSRAWLAERGVDVAFHDFKSRGVPDDRLDAWVRQHGWEAVLNRRGTTWRKLPESAREAVVDADTAIALMREQPSLIRRPVVEWSGGEITIGFDENDWARHGHPASRR